jgi:O-antigen/teichoic acid export membrane protein
MPIPLPEFIRKTFERLRQNPLTQRLIRNSSYVFSATTLSAVLSMAQSILAGRLLGVEAFGMLGAVTQYASVINRLTSFRMSELVVSYIGAFNERGEHRRSAALFKSAAFVEMISSLVAFALVVALAPIGARYLAKDPALAGVFIIYGLSVLANLIAESSTGLLQIYDRFGLIAAATVLQGVVTLSLILVAFLMKGHLQEVMIAYLLGKFVWAGLISVMALRVARKEWGADWWKTPLVTIADRRKDIVRFAISTNLSGTLNLITRDSDILWINALSSPLQGGYYKVAKAFMNILLVPVTPLISTTYREVAREVAGRRWANVRYLLRSGTLLSAIWTIPSSLGLLFFGRWLVMLYGEEFLPAYPILLILLVGVIAANIIYWGRSVLLPLGLPDYPTKVGFVAAGVQIIGMILLVPGWGSLGMAAMMSVFFLINALTLLWKTIVEIRRVEGMYPQELAEG